MHGLFLCPRLLDGAVPIWRLPGERAVRTVFSVCMGLVVQYIRHGVFPRSMLVFNRCGVKVGTRDKQQVTAMRPNAQNTQKIKKKP